MRKEKAVCAIRKGKLVGPREEERRGSGKNGSEGARFVSPLDPSIGISRFPEKSCPQILLPCALNGAKVFFLPPGSSNSLIIEDDERKKVLAHSHSSTFGNDDL